jgi:hypothetical protein
LRATLTIAVLWAVVWLPIGLALAAFASARPAEPGDVLFRPVSFPLFLTVWTAWGAVSGAAFALVLALAERRRTIDNLATGRIALWGALGAASLPVALLAIDVVRTPAGLLGYRWGFVALVLGVSAALGAGCASATLALARRSTA